MEFNLKVLHCPVNLERLLLTVRTGPAAKRISLAKSGGFLCIRNRASLAENAAVKFGPDASWLWGGFVVNI